MAVLRDALRDSLGVVSATPGRVANRERIDSFRGDHAVEPLSLVSAIRSVIVELDSDLPMADVRPMTELF